jgi:hypothetical protein
LEKAIIEHNMLATGKIYLNIRIPELSNILLIDERRTEKVVFVLFVLLMKKKCSQLVCIATGCSGDDWRGTT